MNFLHSIKARASDSTINVIIEVPTGTQSKIEYDYEKEVFTINRILHTKLSFPFNYGFIPETWEGDKDPLDAVVLSSQPIPTGCLIECKVIGMLSTTDEEGLDTKIITVPGANLDSYYSKINSIEDLDDETKSLIQRFYKNYKNSEPEKWVDIDGLHTKEKATKKLNQAIDNYHQHFQK